MQKIKKTSGLPANLNSVKTLGLNTISSLETETSLDADACSLTSSVFSSCRKHNILTSWFWLLNTTINQIKKAQVAEATKIFHVFSPSWKLWQIGLRSLFQKKNNYTYWFVSISGILRISGRVLFPLRIYFLRLGCLSCLDLFQQRASCVKLNTQRKSISC